MTDGTDDLTDGSDDEAITPESDRADAVQARASRDNAELSAVERFRRGTTAGALASAMAMGMANVFDPKRVDTVSVEQEAPSQPVDDEGVELRFNPDSARDTVAVVRPREHDGEN